MEDDKKNNSNFQKYLTLGNIIFSVILLFLFLDSASSVQPVTSSNFSDDVKNLKNTVDNFEEKIDLISSKQQELETSLYYLRWYPPLKSETVFEPSSEGFQKIETSVGNVFVDIQNIEPYANGHKITFHVGNPYAAEMLKVTSSVSYGMSFDTFKKNLSKEKIAQGKGSYEEWNKTFKVVNKDILGGLKPRAWNKLTLILSPSKPEEIETIRLKIEANGLSLFYTK